jgi:Putative Ig domain
MALQRTDNPARPKAALTTRNVQRISVVLLLTFWLVSCSDALPGSNLRYSAASGNAGRSPLAVQTNLPIAVQTNLPTGTVNSPYSGSLLASGDVSPYSFELISGALPSGLTLDPNTGFITGTPTLSATSNFKIVVNDSAGSSARIHAQIVIGPSSTASSSITIAISPTSASLQPGLSQQFSATVQGTSNTAATWTASAGTITSTGLFTAPQVSTNTNVTVTVTSAASGAQASAVVTVGPRIPIAVTVAPNVASIASGGSQQFSASVQGTSNTAVRWYASSGTISSTGLYTAPVVSTNSAASVTAVSAANGNAASASVTVSAPTAPPAPPAPPPPSPTLATSSTSDGPAQLPQTSVPHAFPAQGSANVYNVTAGSAADLQLKINTAAANCGSTGAIVNVPAGNTYTTSSYFNLPATNCDSTHWVVIESSNLASLPAQGIRIGSGNLGNMPLLTTSAPSNPVVMAADNPTNPLSEAGGACASNGPPCGYWLAGLEIYGNPDPAGYAQIALMFLGDYCQETQSCTITSGMTANNLATRITVDRCYIHGASATPAHGVRNGIDLSASYVAIEDSVITNIVAPGYETHGIVAPIATFGPIDIGNNTIEAASIAVFFGSTDPTITGQISSDIYIHQNYLHKLSNWITSGTYLPKDVIECKNCQRMLVEANQIVGDYDSGLNYVALQASPRNAYGSCAWCSVNDVTFRYNWLTNITGFISVLGANASPCPNASAPGCDSNYANEYLSVGSLPTKRVSVHDNVAENVTGPPIKLHIGQVAKCPPGYSGNRCRVSDISIVHNSLVSTNTINSMPSGSPLAGVALIYSEAQGEAPQNNAGYNLVIKDNILPCSTYCMFNDYRINTSLNCTQPTQTCGFAKALNAYWSAAGSGTVGWIFTKNAITNVTSDGWGASAIPVQNSDGSAADNFSANLPASMSNVGFTNWNNGNGGNYLLLNTSPYLNQADDGTDVGANVPVTTNCVTGVASGTPGTCVGAF